VALAWMLDDDTITSPIIGARTVAQLQEVVGAVDVRLSPEEMEALNRVSADF
jgi:aryl-alcohol dehydrogenase-like predicted oxidoreductase